MEARAKRLRIGFVPTMGFLHEGHVSLIADGPASLRLACASIFVIHCSSGRAKTLPAIRDPWPWTAPCASAPEWTPFSARRPRTCTRRPAVRRGGDVTIHGALRTGIDRGISEGWRPFVAKLFNIVQPHIAVFGQKDAQQVRVIQRMVRDLNIAVEVIVGPTVREPDVWR